MQFVSTRGDAPPVSFGTALMDGLAPDGGLYVPTAWPRHEDREPAGPLADFAPRLLALFFDGDGLAPSLSDIAAEAFSFPVPLIDHRDGPGYRLLELFHGPTGAFKDFGARFLAACMARADRSDGRELHILVATSGDTGGAVAAAFHNRPGVRVSVLYPEGKVSPTQERQLTCWDGNVAAYAVQGAFDDCQRLVKEAFRDRALNAAFRFSTANSINIGRLLPQMTYFAAAALEVFAASGRPASFLVPSGNLGHATACAWARNMGLPIDRIVLAQNANRTMPDFLDSGEWRPRPTIHTVASAMDVGNPSNAERLRHLYPEIEAMRGALSAHVVDDDAIRARIRDAWTQHGQILCPHTATAVEAHARLMADEGNSGEWVVVSTAHAAKFIEIVEPLIGQPVPPPASMKTCADRRNVTVIEPDLASLSAQLI